MTLEDLLYKIGETAIKNKIINFSAVGGDIYDLNVENVKDYPVLFAAPTGSHQVRENTTDYEVTFYFLDRLLSDSVNDVQIYSTAIEQLKLILNMVENIKGVLDVSDDYDIQNFTETERMNDRVAGAFSTVNITVQNTSDCCDTEFITLMLKLENKTLNVTKNGKYTVTYNKQYDGLRKVEVDVNVDTETPYQDGFADGKEAGLEEGYGEGYVSGKAEGVAEGIDQGKELAAADAIVVNADKNGTIYTKFSEDIPEWTEPETGNDFYSYALIENISYNTKYMFNNYTKVEFWWRRFNGPTNEALILGTKYTGFFTDSNDSFKVLLNEKSTVFEIPDYDWHHFELSLTDGFKMDGNIIAVFNGSIDSVTTASEIWINGNENSVVTNKGSFGMVIIDNYTIVPTQVGFQDLNTGDFLDKYTGTRANYIFKKNNKYTIVPELIKQTDVNVKISVVYDEIKLGYSNIHEIPEWLSFEYVTDLSYMFSDCKQLSDFSRLQYIDTSKVTNMSKMFSNTQIFNTPNYYEILKNLNVENVKSMSYMFDTSISTTNDFSFMNEWDTSNVSTFTSFFNTSYIKLENFPAIDCRSVQKNSYFLQVYSDYTSLTDMGGLLNMKSSWDNNTGLAKCPNLTRESCINILHGLYDFTGNGLSPNGNQGKLKVHANFITAVGADISIATNKGWQVTA